MEVANKCLLLAGRPGGVVNTYFILLCEKNMLPARMTVLS